MPTEIVISACVAILGSFLITTQQMGPAPGSPPDNYSPYIHRAGEDMVPITVTEIWDMVPDNSHRDMGYGS